MLYCCSFSTNSGDVLNSVICCNSSILQSYNFVWVVGGLGWGKIKCGVLCRLVRWQTPLLILRSVSNFSVFCPSVDVCTVVFRVAPNVFGIAEGGDFSTKVESKNEC